jgi:hypothetical protein
MSDASFRYNIYLGKRHIERLRNPPPLYYLLMLFLIALECLGSKNTIEFNYLDVIFVLAYEIMCELNSTK